MYKKTITYTDFSGEELTEDYYFNLSKAEIVKMQLTVNGGYVELMRQLIQDRDTAAILQNYETLIKASYGKKSLDGRKFVKRPEYLEDFISSGAYDELYLELMTNDESAIEFLNGIAPFVPPEEREKALEESGLKQYLPKTESVSSVSQNT